MSETEEGELEFWDAIDQGVGGENLRVEDNGEILIVEIMPGVFEVVIDHEYVDLAPLWEMFHKLGAPEVLRADVMMTEWAEMEDGRLSKTVLSA